MKFVKLESVSSDINYGFTESATDKNTGHKFLRITDIRDGSINWNEVPFCECNKSDYKKYELLDGDIVFARTGSVGNTGLITDPPKGSVFASYLIRIRPNQEILDPLYLSYFFHSANYWKQIEVGSVGAIQGGINASKLKDLSIPLLSLPEQRRIAELLSRADHLRWLRRVGDALSASLLRSVFLEMFGVPKNNPMSWDVLELAEIGTLDRGRSRNRPRNAPELYGGKYPFIQTGDIANANGYVKSYQQTYSELGLTQSKLWRAGTLCITIAANIAKTAVMTFDACFPDSVVGFVPSERTNVEYVQYWLSFKQKELEDTAPESAQKNINLEILRGLPIPVPPLGLQEQFASVVVRIEGLRARMSEAARQGEELFQSLLSQTFGE